MHDRGRTDSGRHYECFDAEPANEIGNPSAGVIGREVPLIPGQAKWGIRQLSDKRVEVCLRWKAAYLKVQVFRVALFANGDPALGIEDAVCVRGRSRTSHTKDCVNGGGLRSRRQTRERQQKADGQ